jgi:hypothetical protein
MFEKNFLAYLLYITLLEIREDAYKEKNSRVYYLTDLLHNAPFSLLDEDAARKEYKSILSSVDSLNITDWLKAREDEFYKRYPEYNKN